MNLLTNLCSSLFPSLEGPDEERQPQRAIDDSLRFPLLGLIKGAAGWFFLSTILGLIASIQLYSPSFLGNCEWFTYGKLEPMFWNALVYGWLFNAALACAVFLIARLGNVPIRGGVFLTVSSSAWNVGVLIGLIGIVRGEQTPYGLLEFPGYVAPFLFASFVATGIWVMLAFRDRVHRSTYAAHWYICAAFLAFAWSYMGAQVLIFCAPAQGVSQVIVAAWFSSNALLLFIVPMALAVIYYMIPKSLGEPVVGYRYSGITFWAWILFASAAGAASLANGPFPVWLSSLGIISTFALFVPVTTLSIQFLSSLFRRFSAIWDSYSLRYVFVASIAFTIFSGYKICATLRSTLETTQFSSYADGVNFLGYTLFAGFAFSGAIFFVLPRLLNKKLPGNLVDLHFWTLLVGSLVVTASMISGGAQEGELMNQSTASASQVVIAMSSHRFLGTLGFGFILISAIANAVIFTSMIFSRREDDESSNSLFEKAPELEASA